MAQPSISTQGRWHGVGGVSETLDGLKPDIREIEMAMSILLSDRQIAYVRTRTRRGDSKRQVIRRLLNLGIEQQKRTEWAA